MKRIIPYLFFMLLMTGCVKQADWPMPGEAPDLIAVEAILTDENKIQTISISHAVNGLNVIPPPVTGASVLVSDEDSVWQLISDTLHPGAYVSRTPFSARLDHSYRLEILVQGKFYSALASMAPGRLFNELRYKKNEQDNWYHIDWVASAFSADFPAMWEVLIDWSAVPGFEGMDPDQCRVRLLFYTLSTLDVSEIFAPAVEQISFPAGSIITERRYSLTTVHATFLRELLLETNWQGSLFPSTNANVSTNLSEGAAGYFGVCAVTELSLVVE